MNEAMAILASISATAGIGLLAYLAIDGKPSRGKRRSLRWFLTRLF